MKSVLLTLAAIYFMSDLTLFFEHFNEVVHTKGDHILAALKIFWVVATSLAFVIDND